MSRSILLPLLGLGAVVLFGTTRASRPPAEALAPPSTERVEIPAPAAVQRRPVAPPPEPEPPPAPTLRSETEAAEAAAEPADGDTVAVAPGESVPFTTRYVPAPGDTLGR